MASYISLTLEDRKHIQQLWSQPECSARDIAEKFHLSLARTYHEIKRGQDGVTRLPDQRLKYDANLSQLRMQQAFERRGNRKTQKGEKVMKARQKRGWI